MFMYKKTQYVKMSVLILWLSTTDSKFFAEDQKIQTSQHSIEREEQSEDLQNPTQDFLWSYSNQNDEVLEKKYKYNRAKRVFLIK